MLSQKKPPLLIQSDEVRNEVEKTILQLLWQDPDLGLNARSIYSALDQLEALQQKVSESTVNRKFQYLKDSQLVSIEARISIERVGYKERYLVGIKINEHKLAEDETQHDVAKAIITALWAKQRFHQHIVIHDIKQLFGGRGNDLVLDASTNAPTIFHSFVTEVIRRINGVTETFTSTVSWYIDENMHMNGD